MRPFAMPLELGRYLDDGTEASINPDLLRTHLHLIGATGTGKTSAIHMILRQLMLMTGDDKCCLFVIDPMGNLSHDLLNLIVHKQFITDQVRHRVVYVEPAREDVVLPFNPLHHTTEAHRYYQVMRAVDLVLRAWEAQDVSQQPRLLQWTFKTFCAAAQLGLPISICRYLLHPGTDEHRAILRQIPDEISYQWREILNARGGEAVRILESTRNRLDPFFESPNLRYMFGTRQNRFDCQQLIRDRKIVIFNLAKFQRVPGFICDTIGALILNEIFEAASSLTTMEGRNVVEPTYILMDEFQKYVSIDIEDALPTVRQMGLRMILAHQSFAQLDREDVNLEQMIWQARSRLMFANYAKDADLLADEIAKMTYDKLKIKDVRKSRRQLIKGYRREWLESESSGWSSGSSDIRQSGSVDGESSARSFLTGYPSTEHSHSHGSNHSSSENSSTGNSRSESHSRSRSEAMVPIHDNFLEVSSVEYESFDEQAIEWGKEIRSLGIGEAFLQIPGSRSIRKVKIGHLPIGDTNENREQVARLKELNFSSEHFVSMDSAKKEHERLIQEILVGKPIQLESSGSKAAINSDVQPENSPFEL
jgi:hypothetical protein